MIIVSPSVVTEFGVDLMKIAGIDGAQAPVLAQRHGPCLETVNFKALETENQVDNTIFTPSLCQPVELWAPQW